MKNFLALTLFQLAILIIPCSAYERDYNDFHSLKEMIEYETSQIESTSLDDLETLANLYTSRGESYLIGKNIELAIIDLKQGYELAAFCNEDRPALLLRALFSLGIAYGIMDMIDEVYSIVASMKEVLKSCECTRFSIREGISATTAVDVPILGPDRISVYECIERAEGTATKAKYLIALVPKAEIRLILNLAIDGMCDQAIRCCRNGGIWKACLQPIINKWYTWNEKYKLFGIPPDPAWD